MTFPGKKRRFYAKKRHTVCVDNVDGALPLKLSGRAPFQVSSKGKLYSNSIGQFILFYRRAVIHTVCVDTGTLSILENSL